ncbi:flagellar basal body L-ring protein FlgH [Litorivicinus sp.]|jgi:flagellar L-ring protein precursor FlgH|nr:flagellar basal body L-ring protein FlgH [Litorivicinus sp.]
MRLLLLSVSVLCISGCAPQKIAGPSPDYAPVIPQTAKVGTVPTGSVYNAAHADGWFGEKRAFQVGDIITILLDESLDADASANNTASRKTKNDVLSPLQIAKWGSPGGLFSEDFKQENEITSDGSGTSDQSASFTGTMTAQVAEVYANGNLLIRGEKIVNFSSGSEVVQVKGIIRPEDIQPDNTVQSRRLAAAQISYTGVGSNANAQRVPWGTNLIFSLWPF